MKYILFKSADDDSYIIVTFLDFYIHSEVASEFMMKEEFNEYMPLSAGFVSHKNECFGKSISMRLESREGRDTEILKQAIENETRMFYPFDEKRL